MLRIRVLGSAAGGGVPQWNCNCRVCALAREGGGRVIPRGQSSLAVSADGERWCILNCSPDIRQQIFDNEILWPAAGKARHSPIDSVVLTNADIDHIAGLLILREKQAFEVIATPAVHAVLAENAVFNVLDPEFVARRELLLDETVNAAGQIRIEAFAVPGKVALFNEEKAIRESAELALDEEGENTIGLKVSDADSGDCFFYIPGCAMIPPALADRLKGAKLVFFDGTVWENDEMIAGRLGQKTGSRMGHMSMAGAGGSIAAFRDLGVGRKVFIHINNSNQVLIEDSPERLEANAAGWEIARDGMEITL